MDFRQFYGTEEEKPLDRLTEDGGFCGIFRTIACIGDSLSSGEFESLDEKGSKGYHDYFEYSWGQYIARMVGAKVYNFSRGGMTAKEYWDSFAEQNNFWDEDKLAQAYIIALGVNDIYGRKQEAGSVSDIDPENYENNRDTFAGYYARIIQRIKEMQPKARFFLMTMPRETTRESAPREKHAQVLRDMAELFDFTYVIDLERYAPAYDEEFAKNFMLGGHLNAAGYLLTAKITASYIDYIIRHNPEDFTQVGFIGTEFHNCGA